MSDYQEPTQEPDKRTWYRVLYDSGLESECQGGWFSNEPCKRVYSFWDETFTVSFASEQMSMDHAWQLEAKMMHQPITLKAALEAVQADSLNK